MTIRLLADREPYQSYATKGDPHGSLSFSTESDADPAPDLVVLPAESLLALSPEQRFHLPVIAYGPVSLIAAAFEAGCADYLREPWSLIELQARSDRFAKHRFRLMGRTFEIREQGLNLEGTELELGRIELKMLRILVRDQARIVTRQAMSMEIWGKEREGSRVLDVYIGHIRDTLDELVGGAGSRVISCRGLGYRLLVDACG